MYNLIAGYAFLNLSPHRNSYHNHVLTLLFLELHMENVDSAAGNNEKLRRVLENLEEIRDKLVEVNTLTGGLARYNAMKEEIKEKGWSAICSKYHPDINVGDPAAHELFAMYRFVHDTLDREQRSL